MERRDISRLEDADSEHHFLNEPRLGTPTITLNFSLRARRPRCAFFSFFPLLYTIIGTVFIFAARHGTPKPGEDVPPEFLGWIFAAIGSALFLFGLAIAICILITGRSLALRKHYSFTMVMACNECIFIPFGTILGVFTIVVLSRESVRGLFCTAGVQERS